MTTTAVPMLVEAAVVPVERERLARRQHAAAVDQGVLNTSGSPQRVAIRS
jgi:hypothetical protein